MGFADFVLYAFWFLFPLFYFLIALWAKLESVGNKHKREDAGDYVRQGTLVLVVAVVCVVIDQYFLRALVDSTFGVILPFDVPFGFFRIVLFPLVLILLAKVLGPSREISISKAPTLGRGRPRGKK